MSERAERTTAGASADPTELALRLVEETARRQQAEARADTATATADAETARAALAGLRATTVQSIASVRSRDRVDRMAAMHEGLLALRDDLAGLRAAVVAAVAAGAAAEAPATVPAVAPAPASQAPAAQTPDASGDRPVVTQTPEAPGDRPAVAPAAGLSAELARSAQELLARGRLEVADEVIRGLEDAAARLRAQVPPGDDA